MYKAFIIATVIGSPTFQLEDNLSKGYTNINACYARTAQLIREISNKWPVVGAIGVCLQLPNEKTNPKKQETPKGKPTKYKIVYGPPIGLSAER